MLADGRQLRGLHRNARVALEGNDDVLVADEALAGEPVVRRHVVHLGGDDLLAGDLAKLAQQLLLLVGERDAVDRAWREMLDLDDAGAAFAVLAIETDRDFVGLGDREDGAAVARDGVDGDVPRHRRGRKRYVSHKTLLVAPGLAPE